MKAIWSRFSAWSNPANSKPGYETLEFRAPAKPFASLIKFQPSRTVVKEILYEALYAFCIGILMVLIGVAAVGQSSQGRIVGRVTDSTGAIVAKASVTVRNTETGVQRLLETNTAGDYAAPNLNPDSYSVNHGTGLHLG